jgi:hypothetical protein
MSKILTLLVEPKIYKKRKEKERKNLELCMGCYSRQIGGSIHSGTRSSDLRGTSRSL